MMIFHLAMSFILQQHCVKSMRIRSYSSPHFPAFGLNTERSPYLSEFRVKILGNIGILDFGS